MKERYESQLQYDIIIMCQHVYHRSVETLTERPPGGVLLSPTLNDHMKLSQCKIKHNFNNLVHFRNRSINTGGGSGWAPLSVPLVGRRPL